MRTTKLTAREFTVLVSLIVVVTMIIILKVSSWRSAQDV